MDYFYSKLLLWTNFVNCCIGLEVTLFLTLTFFFYLFISSETSFFKIILTIILVVLFSTVLAFYELDFFSGFLLVAELPILVISLLFYFHKYNLQFDSIYFLNKTPIFFKNFFTFFISLSFLLFSFSKPVYRLGVHFLFFEKSYDFTLATDLFVTNRNDFWNYYLFYYNTDSYSTIFVAFLIFIISYLVILIFYSSKLNIKSKDLSSKNILFLRKQSLLKQSIFTNNLKFFNSKSSKLQYEINKKKWEEQLAMRAKAEEIRSKQRENETRNMSYSKTE